MKINTETYTFKHSDPMENEGIVYVDHMRTYITVHRNFWERLADLFRPKAVIVSVQEFTGMVPDHLHSFTLMLRYPNGVNHTMIPATDEPDSSRWKHGGAGPANIDPHEWILKLPHHHDKDWADAMDAIYEERLKREVV